jgi:hypothetical protein
MKKPGLLLALGMLAGSASFAACTTDVTPIDPGDAAPSATTTSPPTPTGTATTPPPGPDAGDSAPPADATADTSADTAADAPAPPVDGGADAADSGAADAADASPVDAADGATSVPATTVIDAVGLIDFDLNAANLVYRTGTATFMRCTLPACADSTAQVVPASPLGSWHLGSADKVHYVTKTGVQSGFRLGAVPLGSTTATYVNTGGAPTALEASYVGGTTERVMLREIPSIVGGGRFSYQLYNGPGGNTDRTPRAGRYLHQNFGGASVTYRPAQAPFATPVAATLAGVTAPVPATDPSAIAITPSAAAQPTLVVVRGGQVEACPLPCAAWKGLGALGSAINVSETHLYVGTATGLMRCELAEIAAAGTCTLVSHGPAESAATPIYVTATDVWYRSDTRVRRVAK